MPHPRRLLGAIIPVIAAGLWLVPGLVRADYRFGFQRPVTDAAEKLLELHNLILLACLGVFVIVFGVVLYSVIAHRKGRGYKAARFHDNLVLEIAWAAIPFVIVIGMAVPSTMTLLGLSDAGGPDMTVKITGYQWKWKYEYPEYDIGFFSSLATPRAQLDNQAAKGAHYLLEVDNAVVLPVDRKIRIVLTAADVIHSWWVPALGVKQDAVPGFIVETRVRIDEPGTYRGQCAELCGLGHGYMPIVVEAVSQEDFGKWVGQRKSKPAVAPPVATAGSRGGP